MYKLLIVDDEKEIRNGLADLPWNTLNIEMVGSCAHGLEALQFVSKQPVDIILTDIRMPFMNGLELMEAVNRQFPFTKIMILSGYNDFDYARQAILSGAADYLLKPVNPDELTASFGKLSARLDAEKQEEYRTSVLERKERLLTNKLREEFLVRLFRSSIPEDELEQASAEGEVLLDGDCYTVAVSRLDRLIQSKTQVPERELKLIFFALENILSDVWDAQSNGYHWVDRTSGQFYLLAVKAMTQEGFISITHQLEKFIGLFKSTLSIGIGRSVKKPGDIRHSARSAEKCLALNREESAIAVYHQLPNPTPVDDFEFSVPIIPPSRGIQEKREGESLTLAQAKHYMHNHYHRSITLKEVAAQVYISPGHLSALFKETGETFLKYLTSLRMQKAVELLSDVSKKVYEVVEMVGYSDPAYFSEVFKKYTGRTPNEFRGIFS